MPSCGLSDTGRRGVRTDREPPAAVTGPCWFAMQKLPPLLENFRKEIPGVRSSDDIEYIHRMRVASRRLRAALPLFRSCFDEQQFACWMREIRKMTRALGEARDTDVQIVFLHKLQKETERKPARRNTAVPDDSPESPALRFLLSGLKKRRALLQKRVIRSLTVLEKSGVTDEMLRVLSGKRAEILSVRRRPPLHGIPFIAALRISGRLSVLLSYDPWIHHPEAVAEHHAARIAAKKLRYTMEVYGTLYRNGLKKPLARVKRIQEILGEIHDRDVWIDHVSGILLRERNLLRTSRPSERPDTRTLASLRVFLQKREAERRRCHLGFVRFWDSLSRSGLWQGLLGTLDQGRRTRFLLPPEVPDTEVIDTVRAIAETTPDIFGHSRHAASLALQLCDQLGSVHGFMVRDRLLLESSGLLHDTGWHTGGRAGHAKRGARAVFTDDRLPFDIRERGIICTAIALHRGRPDPDGLSWYFLLDEESRKRALGIAALLRIADGFDFLHSGAVRELYCTLIADKVFIEIRGTGDLSAEKERARLKADLFTRLFQKRPVIR